jgi:hypothetical protein
VGHFFFCRQAKGSHANSGNQNLARTDVRWNADITLKKMRDVKYQLAVRVDKYSVYKVFIASNSEISVPEGTDEHY